MSKPRIGILTYHPDHRGGTGSYFRAIFDLLRQWGGADLQLLTPPLEKDQRLNVEPHQFLAGRRPAVEHIELEGVPVLVSGTVRRVEAMAYLGPRRAWTSAARGLDALVAVSACAVMAYPLASSGVPYILFAATTLDDEKQYSQGSALRRLVYYINRPFLRAMERRAFQGASIVFALTPDMCRLIERENGLRPGSCRVFKPPVDCERLRPAVPRPGTILWMGRHYDRRKNTGMLLRAAALLRGEFPGLRVTLLGGLLPEALSAEARRLRLDDCLTVPGWVSEEEKLRYLQEADVFAIPSDQEGLCIAGLEGMACGMPLVSTRCGGPEVFVREGENGFLVGRDRPAEMAEKIGLLLRDRALRDRLGAESRRIAFSEFSPAAASRTVLGALAEAWPARFGGRQG